MKIVPIIRRAKIVGSSFRQEHEKAAYQALAQGDRLAFEMEPANPADAFAVKVLTEEGVHVGYIPKEMSGCLYAFAALREEVNLVGLAHGGGLFSLGMEVVPATEMDHG